MLTGVKYKQVATYQIPTQLPIGFFTQNHVSHMNMLFVGYIYVLYLYPLKHTILGTHLSYLGCLSRIVVSKVSRFCQLLVVKI